ncbi:MAG TPA: DUF2207 domain-containing protein, partial [Terriglobales bacterium]|nr:DUF2207 domain-containing protein [Terriglobales bacterium]
NFQATIDVHQDGSALVAERITAVFTGSYQGIYRTIPIEYPGPHGANFALFLNVVGVKDADTGRALRYELHRQSNYRQIKIYVPGATDTDKTIEIDYEVKNATRFFPDHDEFYWNVTGNDWPVPIDRASALLMFPQDAAGQIRAQGFTGIYGSRQQEVTSEVRDGTASFETTNPLPMRAGLTADVFIPKGILREPGELTQIAWFVQSNPVVLLPVIVFAVMFGLWYTVGRDPDPGISVAPMYEPPRDMTPAECGALVDDGVAPRDITCTLVDLAVKGYIKIEEVTEQHLLFSGRDYIFHLLKPRSEWKQLAAHEQVMLENLYAGGGESTRLSTLKNHFYTAIPAIKDDVLYELKQKGLYTVDPDSAHAYLIGTVVAIVVVLLLLNHFGHFPLLQSGAWSVGAVIVSGVIVYLFGRQMTAKSLKGARTYVQILGFEEFMNRVDKDRLKQMPPDTFEKYLPYAMALGVEHRWAQAFAGIIQNPPSWYSGPTPPGYGFNPILFTNSMGYMSSQAHDVFVSAPRSSSTGSGWTGGGFSSGGGFSGGGFGGGGGGAF